MKQLKISTNKRNQMIDITSEIQDVIIQENLKNGIVTIFVPHTTAGITINEGADPSVQKDIIETLKDVIPENKRYRHMEGNSDAHIKASLFGPSLNVIVENGKLILGTWQHIFFYEGDGPRTRTVYVQIISQK